MNNIQRIIYSIIKEYQPKTKKQNKKQQQVQENNIIINNIIKGYIKDNEFVKKKINIITELFKSQIETNEIPFVKEINKKLNKGVPTPVLYVCGKGTQEVRYTKYLAYYLDNKQKHGLNDKLFKAVFSKIIENNNLDITNYNVVAEEFIGTYVENGKGIGNICDIVIYSENINIFIEQKIFSSESDNLNTELKQLERYDIVIDKNFNKKKNIKVFLTPERQNNISSDNWINITHKDIINKCLNILDEVSLSEVAKKNLLMFLSDLSIGPYFDFDIINYLTDLTEKILKTRNINDILEFKNITNKNKELINLLSKY